MRKNDYLVSGAGITLLLIMGAMIQVAVRGLYQDALGKEAYLRVAEAGWASAYVTVPMSLLLLFFCMSYVFKVMSDGRADLAALLDETFDDESDPEDRDGV